MASSSTPVESVDITRVNLSEVQEQVVRDLYDSDGHMINPHDKLASIAKANPGFGGSYMLQSEPTTAYVYMTDTTQTEAAETAFRASHPEDSLFTNIVVVQGTYTLDQLTEWSTLVDHALVAADIHPTSGGVDQDTNQVSFTVRSQAEVEPAYKVVDSPGDPQRRRGHHRRDS